MMDTLSTILTWITTLGSLGAVGIAIVVVHILRDKFVEIETNWKSAVMPAIAFLLFHLGLFWIAPQFWENWFDTDGFTLMQILVVVGFYTFSLNTKPASAVGCMLIILGFVGLSISIYKGYDVLPASSKLFAASTPPPPSPQGPTKVTSIVVAPVAPAWSNAIATPGETFFNPEKGKLIAFRKSNGEIIHGIEWNDQRPIGASLTAEFQSESKEAVNVTVIK